MSFPFVSSALLSSSEHDLNRIGQTVLSGGTSLFHVFGPKVSAPSVQQVGPWRDRLRTTDTNGSTLNIGSRWRNGVAARPRQVGNYAVRCAKNQTG